MKFQLNNDGTLIVVFEPRERKHQLDFLESIEASDEESEEQVQIIFNSIVANATLRLVQ